MSGFTQDDGFFQANYSDNQSYGAGYNMPGDNQQFGQEQQFGQFDYSQGYAEQQYPPPSSSSSPQSPYSGSIMTPDPNAAYAAPSTDNFDDEPPLMEELGINFDHITQKTLAVLNPLKQADHSIMQDTDIAGPLVFIIAFGGSLMLSGKLHFGYIYGIGVMGCLAMYFLLNLMSMMGVSAGCIVSVLGYCLLPMVMLSFTSIAISLQGLLGVVLTVITVFWCSLSASKLFVAALAMDQQQLLVAYPCALVYGVFALLTVF